MTATNDFVTTVATANGSGSQSSNNVLLRAFFRMGLTVGGKNLFPSNIQGLPTWFTIRVNDQGFTARREFADVVVAMNAATAAEDFKLVHPGGLVIMNADLKVTPSRDDVWVVRVPFRDLVANVSPSVKLRKLLVNMAYVGVLAELFEIPADTLNDVVRHQFGGKSEVVEVNQRAIEAGRSYARAHRAEFSLPHRALAHPGANDDRILIDGNAAAAIGLVFGGCTVVAWYPITPSSSIVENFIELAEAHRVDAAGHRDFAVVQAEDELASIAMVLGAGWAGARAMTATSGPGLSLMAEAAGLSYYAEIPAVIWNVQRVGPSTGLPTRTMQGDVLSAYYLSHGDCKHVVLIPGTPNECFGFAQTAFDLAEELQTLVIVLSDLDVGMNLHSAHRFEYPTESFQRGKVLDAERLEDFGEFRRYADVDEDGIPYRTLTGTAHPRAAYFTRGTGHDPGGAYSEDPAVYRANVDRLARKFDTAMKLVPKPIQDHDRSIKIAVFTYGSSHEATAEARYLLQEKGIATNCIRVRALPLCIEVEEFLNAHERVYLVEQNRDGQMMSLLRAELPHLAGRCQSVLNYDGLPMTAEFIARKIMTLEDRA